MKIAIAKNAGFCFGVRSAVIRVSEILGKQSPLYIDGQIIHNPDIVKALEDRGLVNAKNNPPPHGSTVVIRTHGTQYRSLKGLIHAGHKVINLTCPKVGRIQGIIRKHIQNGYHIVITGDPDHPEVRSLSSYAGGNYTVISSSDQIEQVPSSPKMLLLSQTTFDLTAFEVISSAFREKFPGIEIINTICDSTRNRQREIEDAPSNGFDTVVVAGGKKSANTESLARIAEKHGLNAIRVESEKDIQADMFSASENILISAGASTPAWIIDGILNRLFIIRLKRLHVPGFIRFLYRILSSKHTAVLTAGLYTAALSLIIGKEFTNNGALFVAASAASVVLIYNIGLIFSNGNTLFRRYYQPAVPVLSFAVLFLSASGADDMRLKLVYAAIGACGILSVQTAENILDHEKNIIFGVRTIVTFRGIKTAGILNLLAALCSGTVALLLFGSASLAVAVITFAIVAASLIVRRPLFISKIRFLFFLISALFLSFTLVQILK
jgi:4-hydroxy-3-methylbut-2-enyl diphosphate reductase